MSRDDGTGKRVTAPAALHHFRRRSLAGWKLSLFAQPFHPAQVSKLGGDYMRSIGLRASQMHRLRHRFATALLTGGADSTIVADLLGHENLNNTRAYALVSSERMRRAVDLLD